MNVSVLGLASLLLFTFLKGILWASLVAPLDAPDEPSHFNYVAQVREGAWLPVVDLVSPGGLRTPPSTPLNWDLREYFALYDYKFFRSMPYESAQPPLYYWASAIWTQPIAVERSNFHTLLLATRFFSVLLGTLAIFALWLACRWTFGHSPVTWVAPLALTLSPEFSFTTATVSNDAGVVFAGAALLATWAWGLHRAGASEGGGQPPAIWPPVAVATLVTAGGILTKLPFVATLTGTLLWLFWLVRGREKDIARPMRSLLAGWALWSVGLLAGVGLVVAPWLARNLRVYGEPTGARAIFDLIHRIYWDREGFPGDQLFTAFPPDEFIVRSFRSFWALFGWATVWLEPVAYWTLALFVSLSIVGLLYRAWQGRRALAATPPRKLLLLCGITFTLTFLNYIGYNSLVEFQPHMRYTFTALAPALLLIVAGLARGMSGARGRLLAVSGFVVALFLVHVFSLLALWSHTQEVLASVGK